MKSCFKLFPLITITLILSACGGTDSSTGEVASNTVGNVAEPDPVVINYPPLISGTPSSTATVGMLYSFTPSVSDPEEDSLTFSAYGMPGWMSLDNATGSLSGTPTASDVGLSGEIVLTVDDGTAKTSMAPYTITVADSSVQKVVSARIVSGLDDVEEQADGAMYIDSTDLELIYDGEDQLIGLRFAVPVPRNAVITQANLRFTADEISDTETELVIWAQSSDDAEAFSSSVDNVSGRDSSMSSVVWKPQAWNSIGESNAAQTTSDLSALIQEITARPGWRSNNHIVLVVSGSGVRTADSFEGGENNAAVLTVSYSDPTDSNQTPTISGVPDSGATEGSSYSFTPSASDADGDNLTFAVSNKPTWASFDTQSGRLAGTPNSGDAGSYDNISITVSDGELSAALAPFSILVSADNSAPSISGAPSTSVVELSNYSFTPSASDPDGDSLSFNIVNKPSWAAFNSSTGNLSGTPGYDAAGSYGNIVISVSDGSVTASLNPFTINVADLNRTPVISGTPQTSVAEGSSYSFAPSASDADGNSLSYSISNRPTWASFNAATGMLSGTPDYAAAGSYTNIVITVSDGAASASLQAFSISVTDVNQAPVISGVPSQSVTAGSAYSFVPSASDAEGDTLYYSVSNLPSWALFDSATGTLSGTPQGADVGTYSNIQVTVSDGTDTTALDAFSIRVDAAVAATGSISLTWTAPATRADGSSLDISEIGGYLVYLGTSSDNLQVLVDINDRGATAYTIEELQLGTYYIAVTTYDMDGNASSFSNVVSKNVTN